MFIYLFYFKEKILKSKQFYVEEKQKKEAFLFSLKVYFLMKRLQFYG